MYLGQASSEEDALKELAHPLQELVTVRPLQHVHLMYHVVYLHGNDEVSIADGL